MQHFFCIARPWHHSSKGNATSRAIVPSSFEPFGTTVRAEIEGALTARRNWQQRRRCRHWQLCLGNHGDHWPKRLCHGMPLLLGTWPIICGIQCPSAGPCNARDQCRTEFAPFQCSDRCLFERMGAQLGNINIFERVNFVFHPALGTLFGQVFGCRPDVF